MSSPAPAEALIQRILEGGAPLAVRSAAARGALPLSRAVLARLFLHLRNDPLEEVRTDAEASLGALAGEALREVVSDPACAPEVLVHFAPIAARDESLAESIAFHPLTPDSALGILAARGGAAVVELVLTNQQRLLSSPDILNRLMENPALRADQRGRILDLLERFVRPTSETEVADDAVEVAPIHAEQAAKLLDVDVGELIAASEILDGAEFDAAPDPRIRSAYRKILTLSTAQKAILAMKGGRDERTILIRDTNKVVAVSVLKNPRITETEVEAIAAMRNVSDEVLRSVGTNREWSKNYGVMAALVRNPRTPPGVSTNFIPMLSNRDLKGLATDKNVPEIIRRNAKRTYDLRTQKVEKTVKKK